MLVSSLVVLVLLHGISSLKILLILYLNFRLPDIAGHASKATPYLIWTFNVAILFLNEIYRGYKFGSILPLLAFLVSRNARVAASSQVWLTYWRDA